MKNTAFKENVQVSPPVFLGSVPPPLKCSGGVQIFGWYSTPPKMLRGGKVPPLNGSGGVRTPPVAASVYIDLEQMI